MKRILVILGLAFLIIKAPATAGDGGPGYKNFKKKCKVVQHGHKTSFKGRCDRMPPDPVPGY
jgi:hypothetical protein